MELIKVRSDYLALNRTVANAESATIWPNPSSLGSLSLSLITISHVAANLIGLISIGFDCRHLQCTTRRPVARHMGADSEAIEQQGWWKCSPSPTTMPQCFPPRVMHLGRTCRGCHGWSERCPPWNGWRSTSGETAWKPMPLLESPSAPCSSLRSVNCSYSHPLLPSPQTILTIAMHYEDCDFKVLGSELMRSKNYKRPKWRFSLSCRTVLTIEPRIVSTFWHIIQL